MGLILGVSFIVIALVVGVGITIVANNNVKKFKEDEYESFTDCCYVSPSEK